MQRTITKAQADFHLSNGKELNFAGNFADAISELEIAFLFFSNNSEAYPRELAETEYYLGNSHLLLNNEQIALTFLQHANEFYSNEFLPISDNESYLLHCSLDLFSCCQALGEVDSAPACLRMIKNHLPHFASSDDDETKKAASEAYCLLAEYDAESNEEAADYLRCSLQVFPENPAPTIKLAATEIELKQYSQAETRLDQLYLNTDWSQEEEKLLVDCSYHLARCKLAAPISPASNRMALNLLQFSYDAYQKLNDHESSLAALLGLSLACYRNNQTARGDLHLKAVLSEFRKFTSREAIATANDIIVSWCAITNYPDGFQQLTTTQNELLYIKNQIEHPLRYLTAAGAFANAGTPIPIASASASPQSEKKSIKFSKSSPDF